MGEIVIVGSPGSGKTTLWQLLWDERPSFSGASADFELSSAFEGFVEKKREPFKIAVPVRNFMLCAACALCQKSCPFGAIWEEDLWIDPLLCEGCGLCVKNCPNQALQLANMQIGELVEGELKGRKFFTGRIFAGARGGPRLLRALREKYREENVLLDVPPRYGDFLSAALEGAEKIFLVLSPEEGAFYLMDRISFFAPKSEIFFLINKTSENDPLTPKIRAKGEEKGFKFVASVPRYSSFDEIVKGLKGVLTSFLELAKI